MPDASIACLFAPAGSSGWGSSSSPPMQTLKAAAQLTAPLLTTIATLSLHMDPYKRTVAFVGQWTAYRGRNSPPPTHSPQRLSQLDQQALPAPPMDSDGPSHPLTLPP